ncbi:heme-binding domain-containing protein [Sediminibacterium sp.]|jgi:Haem-binding domain|uniref:heme-binding domain-containing protein n=1 Tax=Sediminibacterium sp. TaxID=1917865 RepID=UPI0025F97AAF|nr:heme-binding domain-containing protein [Sediminibacterium sp.]MDO8995722.1 heme-binding domain-containing protein [Sediminibacterium sp.]MDP1971813.1 heme-binding domain-containing protein [Sediminibacterium sp.]MDP2421043.1 heme-binding domain-containing protein [Sediminibacterium sp.]
MLKKLLLVLFVILLVLQAFRPEKNTSANKENDISSLYPVPDNVEQILVKACNDCHSNSTVYPWYAEVQPIAWWLDDHVKDGKKHLNFNEFASYRLAKQFHKLEEVFDEVKGGEMPLESYTVVHRDANLTDAERNILMDWSVAVRDTMKARFPADSLIMKKKK